MARTLAIVKHTVNDFGAWQQGYDGAQALRDSGGVTDAAVYQDPADPNEVTVLHWFGSVRDAEAFTGSAELKAAMQQLGVAGPPRIELVVEA